MKKCFSFEPNDRPSFKDIVEILLQQEGVRMDEFIAASFYGEANRD